MRLRNLVLSAVLALCVGAAQAQTPTQDAAKDIEQLLLQELETADDTDFVNEMTDEEMDALVAEAARELHGDLLYAVAVQMVVLAVVFLFVVA